MKRFISSLTISACMLLPPAGAVLAAANPAGTGQPNQSCQSLNTYPGGAGSAPGSAFNEPGVQSTNGGTAGAVYAGNGQTQNTPAVNSGHAIAQYDVACFQQPN